MADHTTRSSFLTALIDPFTSSGNVERGFRPRLSQRAWGIPLLMGIALLVASAVGWALLGEETRTQFYFSYLTAWTFCLTLSLGALFFVMVFHVTKSRWVVVVRRIPEALAWSFPLLMLLSIPILFGMHDLYHWMQEGITDPSSPHYDEIIAGKSIYLNVPFFMVRLVVYFAVWTYLAYRLNVLSARQDRDPDPAIQAQQRKVSAWGLPVFSLATAFASYDLLMSLDPHWFSTIFGVYFWAGSFVSAIALTTILCLVLQKTGGMLKNVVTVEHYHDLGKLLFAFTAFWAYIAFSQYILIWYGGIPEETVWFRHRFEHGWIYFTMALIIGHFALPFLVLMFRASKRILPVLSIMAVWMVVMHWIDLYWIVMPVYDTAHHARASFHWLDLTCWLGLFGVYLGALLFRLSRHSLVPQRDPYLRDSLRFENV